MQNILVQLKNMPYLFVLFYLQRNEDTEIGKMIKQCEENLLKVFQKDFPQKNKDEILKIYLLELGAVAYQLPSEKIGPIFKEYIN